MDYQDQLRKTYQAHERAVAAGDMEAANEIKKVQKQLLILTAQQKTAQSPNESFVAGLVNQVGQGLTAGFADEISAGLDFTSDNPYEMDVDLRRTGLEEWRKDVDSDVLTFAADMFGGALGFGKLKAADKTLSVVDKAKHYAKQGAGIGALEGAGRSEGETVGEVATDIGVGAGTGTILNPALTGAMSGGAAILSKMRGWWRQISKTDLQKAQEMIQEVAEQTGNTAEELFEQLQELGPDATLLDINDALTGLGNLAKKKSTAALTTIVDMVRGRQAGATDRVQGAVREAGGNQPGYLATQQGLQEAKKTAGSELYGAVEGTMVPRSPELRAILDHDYVKPLLKEVEATESLRRGEAMTFDGDEIPLALLDSLKKSFDDQVTRVTDKMNKTNKNRNMETLFGTFSRQLRKLVDTAEPNYAQARETSEAYSRLLTAGETGANIQKTRGVKLDETVEDVQNLSLGEQEAFRTGATDAIERSVIEGGRGGKYGNRVGQLSQEGDPQVRLDALATSPQARDELQNVIDAEGVYHQTMKAVDPNIGSKTSAVQDVSERGAVDVAEQMAKESLMFGSPGTTAAKMIIDELGNANKISRATAEEIANILVKPDMTKDELSSLLARKINITESQSSAIMKVWDSLRGSAGARPALVGEAVRFQNE